VYIGHACLVSDCAVVQGCIIVAVGYSSVHWSCLSCVCEYVYVLFSSTDVSFAVECVLLALPSVLWWDVKPYSVSQSCVLDTHAVGRLCCCLCM